MRAAPRLPHGVCGPAHAVVPARSCLGRRTRADLTVRPAWLGCICRRGPGVGLPRRACAVVPALARLRRLAGLGVCAGCSAKPAWLVGPVLGLPGGHVRGRLCRLACVALPELRVSLARLSCGRRPFVCGGGCGCVAWLVCLAVGAAMSGHLCAPGSLLGRVCCARLPTCASWRVALRRRRRGVGRCGL